MKSFFVLTLTIILLFILQSCHPKDNTFTNIEMILENQSIPPKTQIYVFLPLNGCGMCIEKSIAFIKKEIDNEYILFVVSATSRKEASLNFSIAELNSSQLILLNEPLLSDQLGLTHGNLVAYRVENSVIVQKWATTPENIVGVLREIKHITKN